MKCNRIHVVSRAQLKRLAAMRSILRKIEPRKRWRCADCGGFVSRDYADLHPSTTLGERVP